MKQKDDKGRELARPLTAKDVAIAEIKAYVLRGDSYDQLRAGQQGSTTDIGASSIGGWLGDKRYSTHFLLVTRIGSYKKGKQVAIAFKLKDIYNEIKTPTPQMALL